MYTMNCPDRARDIIPNIKNKGIHAHANVAFACGYDWRHHDSLAFDMGSDIEYNGDSISVKAFHFTLMAGTMCEGKTTLEDIWEVYARRTHSNKFAYVVNEVAYIMNLEEFKAFVFKFCAVERESNHSDRQHTGSVKVRARRNEKDMVKWFKACMAD